MAPAKSSRKDGLEECLLKPEPAGAKEKGNANGKIRRVASSTNSSLREVTSASAAKEASKATITAAATTQDAAGQGVCRASPFPLLPLSMLSNTGSYFPC